MQPVESVDRPEPVRGYRLSPQQRRAWALAAGAEPESGALPACCPARLEIDVRGPLEVSRLRSVLQDVVTRHEVLRSRFHCPPGLRLPVQIVTEAVVELTVADAAETRKSPEPAVGSAIRARLIRLAPERWTLELELTALQADSRGLRQLAAEVAAAYGGGVRQGEEPMRYVDLAEWQNELAHGDDAEQGRRFWANRRPGDTRWLRLPLEGTGGSEPPELRFTSVTLGEGVAAATDRLAERSGVSPAAVILAAWATLLGRLTGRREVPVATCYDGRSYEGLERVIGPLERYLPLRLDCGPRRRFREVAGQAFELTEELYDWQEFYQPQDDVLLPWAFLFEEGETSWRGGEASFSLTHHSALTERFVVRLAVFRRAAGPACSGALDAELAYDAGRLTPDSARRMAERLSTLLAAAVLAPDRFPEDLDVVSPAEREVIEVWSVSSPEVPGRRPADAVRLFLERVEHGPDRIAVICAGQHVSYRRLAAVAGDVACRLRRRGVGPETLVGICLDRSPDMVAGVFGVLMAGGAYVPLDPAYPRERNLRVAELARPALILTRGRLRDALPAPAQVLRLDEDCRDEDREERAPSPEADPQSLAYVMFTSGSTGEPKGVMVSHANLAHYLDSLPEALGVGGDDVFLHTASFAFSSSVRHLLVPLSRGAALVLATDEERSDPKRLLGLARNTAATVMDTVPSLWRGCLKVLGSPAAAGYRPRLALSTGEVLAAEVPREWERRFEDPPRFVNMYGQTETAGMVALHPVPRRFEDPDGMPLGRPIRGVAVFVLDRRSRLSPIGCTGEIHVAGGAPGRGYLRRPALTAERFVPDPHSGRHGSRLLRTGDLGFFDGGGCLRFVGRLDHQVQVRGHRVEPGEIEAALGAHPDVELCAVRARDSGSGEIELAAYVARGVGRDPEPRSLRAFLEERLAPYMVPSRFLVLDELPMTPNGKVDRLALPELEEAAARPYVAPSTELERQLAEIWAAVLAVERVGLHDDFFDLGGHSMRAILIMSRLQERYGVDLPAFRLFEVRTVAQLALLVEELQLADASDEDLAEALQELAELSDEEVRDQLADEA
jgi:amino acid adenylation domain-containing protein